MRSIILGGLLTAAALPCHPQAPGPFDPLGRLHIPIGIANTLDGLKTFVEAEGNFSPGFGSYGVYFWVWDPETRAVHTPTFDGAHCEHGLGEGGALIPWSKWKAGNVDVRTEVCEVSQRTPQGDAMIVGTRVRLSNPTARPRRVSLFLVVRELGPAGGRIDALDYRGRRALLVNGRPAVVAETECDSAFTLRRGPVQSGSDADSEAWGRQLNLLVGEPEEIIGRLPGPIGALRYEVELKAGRQKILGFVSPVLPGRRVMGHKWDGVSSWAQYDLNAPNPSSGGVRQPDPGLDFYRQLKVDDLFKQAATYWKRIQGGVKLRLPDPRWAESFAAILGHCAMNLNEGAPDVAVVNYNVYNRDGMYLANIFQKSRNVELAEAAIDYFLRHPFNGRVQPEADNPGQILWVMGEHWKFTRDERWLRRVYSSVRKLAAMIRYYRTAPGPHWVWDTSLDCGDALPREQRKELKPGACDGVHPEYTEAYDVAGLRYAAVLAEAAGTGDAPAWRTLAGNLMTAYEQRFSTNLPRGYGSYSVLWPCRLFPFSDGPAHDQFRGVGAQKSADWRYFPLARAHQGLLAGNREAGWRTLDMHLAHSQMQGWYAFDEGGPSGVGGWHHLKGYSSWQVHPAGQGNHAEWAVAMPHGWAIAEFQLLLRDCLAFEDGDRLVLLGGVPDDWFRRPDGMSVENLPTHFGRLSFAYRAGEGKASLTLRGDARPPGGFVLRCPPNLVDHVTARDKPAAQIGVGDFLLPAGTRAAELGLLPAVAPR